MDEASKVHKAIRSELAKRQPDYAKLANLYDGLANAEEDRVRFSVEASHINRLGLELVGRRETALSELIKNAYDADATKVDVLLENFSSVDGTMTISDNGVGMTRETIRTAWMRLSTNSKSGETESPGFGRPRAGRKGIGRFATQRLGKKLILETCTKGSGVGLRATFNWDADYVEGRDLSTIWTEIEEFECLASESGTKLVIPELRDRWTSANLKNVWKSILFLQPPFPITGTENRRQAKAAKGATDPGFQVEINGSDEDGREEIVSLENNLLQYALAQITANIDKRGKATFRLDSPILDASEKIVSERKFLLTGPVKLEARYFIYGRGSVPGISARLAKGLGTQYGGIRIHRNSFRVPPYGEPNDDWLALDRDVGRRNILPPANNSNFFGHIEIDGTENLLLEETSSREGLVENEALEELRYFARSALEWAVLRVAAIRGRKQKATQKDHTTTEPKATEAVDASLSNLSETIEDLSDKISDENAYEQLKAAIASTRTSVSSAISLAEQAHQAERERNIEYESMLRVLASLGLSISVFGHEIKSATSLSSGAFSLLNIKIKEIAEKAKRDEIQSVAAKLKSAVERVFDLGGYIEDLTSYANSRKMSPVPVQGAIRRFTDQFSSYMDRYSVQFDHAVEPKGLRTCQMHSSEFDSVLFNLLTNSMKAFQRVDTRTPKILIRARRDKSHIVLRFEDNGHKIAAKDRDHIFDAFYTTTEFSQDDVAGPGTGLGLKIVSDIAESYGGQITLAEPSKGYITCFEVTLRSNQ
ncbi:MAG: ATP-binding protein [Candidatus Phaeomarinobacter sp.]